MANERYLKQKQLIQSVYEIRLNCCDSNSGSMNQSTIDICWTLISNNDSIFQREFGFFFWAVC